jgi:hypothetical protein
MRPRKKNRAKQLEAGIRGRPPQQRRAQAGPESSHAVSSDIHRYVEVRI